MKSAVGLASVALAVGQASLASAAPTCAREASQLTVVFSVECTKWFQEAGHEKGEMPKQCTQELSGGVLLDAFPWNDDVVVVDDEYPSEDFSLQPARNVVKYGAGIVIMQTTWDMKNGYAWHVRDDSNAERVHHEVEYLTSEGHKYIDLDLHVHYSPPSRNTPPSAGDGSVEGWFNTLPPDSLGQEDSESFSYSYAYYPTYVYSYDQETSWSFEIEDLEVESSESYSYAFDVEGMSYSYGFGFDEELTDGVDTFESVTSLDIYVCTDEDNNLAEIRFYCDPDMDGNSQCFKEAGRLNVDALDINDMSMYCDKNCLNGESGGLWCDIFGLDGCRMCSNDCSSQCGGKASCSSCIRCPGSGGKSGESPSPVPPAGVAVETNAPEGGGSRPREFPTSAPTSMTESAAPTDGTTRGPGMTMSPTSGMETASPPDDGKMTGAETDSPTPSATDGSRGLETSSPTDGMMPTDRSGGMPIDDTSTEFATPAPSTTDGSRGVETSSPTAGMMMPTDMPAEDMQTEMETPAPSTTDGSHGLETSSPTEGMTMPTGTETDMPTEMETPAPSTTDGSRGLETSSPTEGMMMPTSAEETDMPTEVMPTEMETPAPSTTDGSRGLETSSPTEGTMAPTDGSMSMETSSPTEVMPTGPHTDMPTEFETPAPSTTDGSRSSETSSPTSAPTAFVIDTSASTPGPTGYATPSPTAPADGSRGLESAAPTAGLRSLESAAPTIGMRGLESAAPTPGLRGFETASPTSSMDGSRAIPMMSAAPTSAMGDLAFGECAPGNSQSCYDQLDPVDRSSLEERGRGLTCEASCIVDGGLWCSAYGINGTSLAAHTTPDGRKAAAVSIPC
eukprot:jgi/Undpi1/3471/HiC_scaffold_16.g06843.m1